MTRYRHSYRKSQRRAEILGYLHKLQSQNKQEIPKISLPERVLNRCTLAALLNSDNRSLNITLTKISEFSDLETYYNGLRTNPLLLSHPKFSEHHFKAWWYFQIMNNPRLQDVPSTLIAECSGIRSSIIDSWRRGDSYPRILFLLAERGRTLSKYQQRAAELLRLCGGLCTISDVYSRISPDHFFFGSELRGDSNLVRYREEAFRFFAFLELVQAAFHPVDIEFHFKLGDFKRILFTKSRPYIVRVASTIPKEAPREGLVWLPTVIDESKMPARYIQVPRRITQYQQLIPVLEQLVTLNNPDAFLIQKLESFGPPPHLLQQWIQHFREVESFKDLIRAFAYALVGAALSDGCIPFYTERSRFSSNYQLALSRGYRWSKRFGDRVAYFLTCLGIPMKPVKDRPSSEENPQGSFVWHSIKSPFLVWVNRAVLGFEVGETHTDTPAQID